MPARGLQRTRARRFGRPPVARLRLARWGALVRWLAAAACLALPMRSAQAQVGGDLTRQEPVEVTLRLGDERGALRFFPDRLEFVTGKLYRLVLVNRSPDPHYFSSDGMSQAVFTRKVQVNGPVGERIAEIKGTVREIEVFPGGTAEWWFVAVKTGEFRDLVCTVAGHAEAGMTGRITIR